MECAEIKIDPSKTYNCDYVPPTVQKLLIRKKEDGQIQVQINGEGEWINATIDNENVLRFIS